MLTVFLQQILNGLVLGGSYALMALGLTMIFGILEVINFAHGEIYMIGAFMTLYFTTLFGVPFLLAIPYFYGCRRFTRFNDSEGGLPAHHW